MTTPTTHIEWTIKLADAGLIIGALQEVAQSAERQADYLESESYANKQRAEFVAQEQEKIEGPRRRATSWPGLSESDKQRIEEYRTRAAWLRQLINS